MLLMMTMMVERYCCLWQNYDEAMEYQSLMVNEDRESVLMYPRRKELDLKMEMGWFAVEVFERR